MMTLPTFSDFFRALHGVDPFIWQDTLANQIADCGTWPSALDVPTGCGKTATLDIAVWLLAHRAIDQVPGHPRRIFFVVDRRIVVDSAYERATRIATALQTADNGVLGAVADALRRLTVDRGASAPVPLRVVRLRGGAVREADWARSTTDPMIIVSTVDQVGSRLMFRGYGLTPERRPVHASLVGMDSLILLDEAHLSRPFRQTAHAIGEAQPANVSGEIGVQPLRIVTLSATQSDRTIDAPVEIAAQSEAAVTEAVNTDARLHDRLSSPKRTTLVDVSGRATGRQALIDVFLAAYDDRCSSVERDGVPCAVAIIVNRVDTARRLFESLRQRGTPGTIRLLIGPSRPLDKDALTTELYGLVASGRSLALTERVTVVATQCIEVGADFDFDVLLTESAPLDSLRQRFGRLDRLGRHVSSTDIRGVVVHLQTKDPDPIYGNASVATMGWLRGLATDGVVAMGVRALQQALLQDSHLVLADLLAPSANAPLLHPGIMDVMAETSQALDPDLDVALYLHGPQGMPQVSLAWRESVDPTQFEHLPISSLESITLPLHRVRNLLSQANQQDVIGFTDIESVDEDESDDDYRRLGEVTRPVNFTIVRDGVALRSPEPPSTRDLRPDDTIVLSCSAGGCDPFGLTGQLADGLEVPDYCEVTATIMGRAAMVRITPRRLADWTARRTSWDDFVEQMQDDPVVALADLLAELTLPSSDPLRTAARDALVRATSAGKQMRVHVLEDTIVLFCALQTDADHHGMLRAVYELSTGRGTLPDELTASLDRRLQTNRDGSAEPMQMVTLERHVSDVRDHLGDELRRYGFASGIETAIEVAAEFHDEGKRDPRFQAMLRGVARLSRFDTTEPLAKSGRPYNRLDAPRAGLPSGWRHEALSAIMAADAPAVSSLSEPDRDLVIWLIATHHGHGRSFFVPPQREDGTGEVEPHRALNTSQAARGMRLTARFGSHGLALLETVFRLADCAASAQPSEGDRP